VVLLTLGGFFWYWDILIPTRQVTMSDPSATAYQVSENRYFVYWSDETYVVNLKEKSVVIPSRYGHHCLGIWIWPRGLDNYKGVRVGDEVKEVRGKFTFEGNKVLIEHPLHRYLELQFK
jgi:hypothetical protein